jgi:hypothetical protein
VAVAFCLPHVLNVIVQLRCDQKGNNNSKIKIVEVLTRLDSQAKVQYIDTTVPLLAEIVRQLKIANELLECLVMDKSSKDWQSKYKRRFT